ncbi:hypothetical protein [Streptomyces sp. NBC_01190]|uniref:hypothetical protein n=1 Tax=Streptomyces sp. NBC_01190 TaxID=2903767 RepID=UPI0038704A5D|nr:hypothetical protein OG519_28360 [Streptomyces sp. NBC_01190]
MPYITLRKGEESVPESMLGIRYNRTGVPIGLCYRWEMPRDRDDRGVLWARTSQSRSPDTKRPAGKPIFASMHPSRQREMMASLRCQVCGGQPSRTEEGYLFLEKAGNDGDPEGITTGQPPVCLDHALAGIEMCSHLIEHGYVLLRSKVPRLHGVLGQVYTPVDNVLEPLPPLVGPDGSDLPLPYTMRELTPWVLASQLLRRLTRVTVTDIDRELAMAGKPARPAADAKRSRNSVMR